MSYVTLRSITASAILSMALIQGACAADNTGATLIRPSQDAQVEMMSEVTGKVLMRGWPIVLVRADLPDCLWWSQEWAEPTAAAGYFKAKVRFGNDKSKDGSRFRLIVVMAKSEEDARRFQPGSSFKDLPEDLPRSTETVVVLKRWQFESEALAGVIKSPTPNSQVGRIETVVGKAEKDSQPVVLVRSAESNSQWWVQAEPRVSEDGSFSTTARFGNLETPAGTRFKLLVVFPTKTQARAYNSAEPIQQLPKDISHSTEVEVIRIDSPKEPQTISTTTPDS